MLKGCKIPNLLSINKLYSFFRKEFEEGYFFKGESHNFYEVVCVIRGHVGVTAGSRVFKLHQGEAIFHPPGEFHAIWNEGDNSTEAIIFSFSATTFPVVVGKVFALNEEQICKIKNIHLNIESCFSEKISSIIPDKEISAALTVKELEIFLITIFGSSKGYTSFLSAHSTDLFSMILDVMVKNISSNLDVGELAAQCNVSIPTLEKTVYKYLGYGAIHHYNTLKMQKAQSLLLDGATVKETATSLGFSNQNYFSARFKKYYGYPPSYVRKK